MLIHGAKVPPSNVGLYLGIKGFLKICTALSHLGSSGCFNVCKISGVIEPARNTFYWPKHIRKIFVENKICLGRSKKKKP